MMNDDNNKEEQTDKVGNIPQEEASGSDADKAYDENGEFGTESATENGTSVNVDAPSGSDADINIDADQD